MAHNIMSDSRFYAHRTPAWHGLGHVSTEPLDAIAAADRAGISALKTFTTPLWIRGHSGLVQAKGFKALCGCLPGDHQGGAITTNGETKTVFTYGVVSDQYEPIFHEKALTIWNDITGGAPVETVGLLGYGETLFVTTQLPSTAVANDKLHNYLMLMNPLDGLTSVRARTLTTRVVCANTLAMGLSEWTDHDFRATHYAGVADKLATWLECVWQAQSDTVRAIQEACNVLALISCSPATLKDGVLSTVYPYPPKPEESKLLETWVDFCARMESHRSTVAHLFLNSPTRSPATTGTLWGAYNAVVEYEDFARTRTTARSRFLGSGKNRKEAAFTACISLV